MSFKVHPRRYGIEPDAARDAQWQEWARRESRHATEQQARQTKQECPKDDLDRD